MSDIVVFIFWAGSISSGPLICFVLKGGYLYEIMDRFKTGETYNAYFGENAYLQKKRTDISIQPGLLETQGFISE
jgi:hypothetical protein